MGIDLDCAATFGAILTIFGDTFALLSELSEKNSENEDEDKNECNGNDNSGKQGKDSNENDSDEGAKDEGDSGGDGVLLGTFISFIGDLIEAVVGYIQAYQKYGPNAPYYIERGIIGSWVVVIGDILQLQSLIAEEAINQENQGVELSLI